MRIECGQGLITELIIFKTIMETVLWLHDEAVFKNKIKNCVCSRITISKTFENCSGFGDTTS